MRKETIQFLLIVIVIIFMCLSMPHMSYAQAIDDEPSSPGAAASSSSDKDNGSDKDKEIDDGDSKQTEKLYDDAKNDEASDTSSSTNSGDESKTNSNLSKVSEDTASSAKEEKKDEKLKALSDLKKLAPFKDVIILQKKFFPKSRRFEFFAGGSYLTNDSFFFNGAVNLRLAYQFNETYGVELSSTSIVGSEKEITNRLKTNRGLTTRNIVVPKAHYGLDFKWVPSYGKYSFRDTTIVPFDMYFSFGFGSTTIESGNAEPTFHVGTGQILSSNKNFGMRWDFSWNFFTSSVDQSRCDNIFLAIGLSWVFPRVKSR